MAIYPAIYTTNSLPQHYVIEGSDDALYLVPTISGGWSRRTPYHGNYTLIRLPEISATITEVSLDGQFDFRTAISRPWIGWA